MPFYIRYYANREDTSAVFLGLLLPSFPGSGTFNQTGYLNGMTGEYEEPGTNFY